jgi:hydroxymethylpyrimidine/phosphomethylpyrimidine kinase
MSEPFRTPRALTIAGSDSGGGAGIQADLKAFARCGVHGMSAITAITAQNTLGVSTVHTIPAETILAQVRAVLQDIGVDAVKVGMLGSAETVHAVAQALAELPPEVPVVVDPVMVSESGAQLLEIEAQGALVTEILPRATILTPNLPEARVLAGYSQASWAIDSTASETEAQDEEAEALAIVHAILSLGPQIVVLTGGHRRQATDLFLRRGEDPEQMVSIPGARHPEGAAHGSGCTHSSLLAAQLALGRAPLQAAFAARALAGEAVALGLRDIGQGPGPVDVLDLERMRHGAGGRSPICHNREA